MTKAKTSSAPVLGLLHSHLRYLCNDPKIDEATQEPKNCRDTTAWGERVTLRDVFVTDSAVVADLTSLGSILCVCPMQHFSDL